MDKLKGHNEYDDDDDDEFGNENHDDGCYDENDVPKY